MIQIRRGTFETNSSSVHALCLCTVADALKWERGKMVYDWYSDKLVPVSESVNEETDPVRYLSADKYDEKVDYNNFETFEEEITLPSGEKVIAFGYFGVE